MAGLTALAAELPAAAHGQYAHGQTIRADRPPTIDAVLDEAFWQRIEAEDEWWIAGLDPATGESERIARTRPGREDYAWTPAGELLMGDGTALYAWTAATGWIQVAELAETAPGDISRIAVSPDGATIAIVRSR